MRNIFLFTLLISATATAQSPSRASSYEVVRDDYESLVLVDTKTIQINADGTHGAYFIYSEKGEGYETGAFFSENCRTQEEKSENTTMFINDEAHKTNDTATEWSKIRWQDTYSLARYKRLCGATAALPTKPAVQPNQYKQDFKWVPLAPHLWISNNHINAYNDGDNGHQYAMFREEVQGIFYRTFIGVNCGEYKIKYVNRWIDATDEKVIHGVRVWEGFASTPHDVAIYNYFCRSEE